MSTILLNQLLQGYRPTRMLRNDRPQNHPKLCVATLNLSHNIGSILKRDFVFGRMMGNPEASSCAHSTFLHSLGICVLGLLICYGF